MIDFSEDSVPFTIIAATKPDEPTTFVRDENLTTKTQVAFSWSPPSNTGALPLIDYEIEMDDNNDGVYTQVASGVTSTSYTKTDLSAGNSYHFRVRARNSIDFSDYSSVFTIIAATKPEQPTTFVRNEISTTKT